MRKKLLTVITAMVVCLLPLTLPCAAAGRKDVVPPVDFGSETRENGQATQSYLEEQGFTVTGYDSTVHTMEVVDHDAEHGKALRLVSTADNTPLSLKMNFLYEPKANDVLVIEYDVWFKTGTQTFDAFPAVLSRGGDMITQSQQTFRRGYMAWRFNDAKNGLGDDGRFAFLLRNGSLTGQGHTTAWRHVKEVYDLNKGIATQNFSSSEDLKLRESECSPATVTAQNVGAIRFDFGKKYWQETWSDGTKETMNQGGYNGKGEVLLDNLQIYALESFEMLSSSPAADETDVLVSAPVSFTANNDIDSASAELITVTAGGVPLAYGTDFTVAVSGATVSLTFADGMEYATTYTVDVSGIKDAYGQSISGGATSISYTTEAAPLVILKKSEVLRGMDDTAAVTSGLAADGSLQGQILSLQNTTNAAQDVVLIFVDYRQTASGSLQLAGVEHVTKSIAANSLVKLGCGSLIGSAAEGMVRRVFIWNTPEGMRPWRPGITTVIGG